MTRIFHRSVSLGKGTVASKANSLHTVTLDEASSNDEDSSHHNVSVEKPVFRGATLNEMIGSESSKLSRQAEEKAILEILHALTEEEKREIPDPCMIIRHYRAEKGNTSHALKKLRQTLVWRKKFGVADLLASMPPVDPATAKKELSETLSRENETGKIYVRGFDHQGRAFMYMRPARENTGHEANNMKHLVWNLEKAAACTARHSSEKGTEYDKFCLLIDYDGFKLTNAPPMSTTKLTLDIVQNHYPERLYRAYFLNPPMVFRVFWNVAKAFVDPATKEKIVFCNTKAGLKKLGDDIEDKRMLEPVAGGPSDGRSFDSKEYMHLPFDVTFGE